MRNASYKPVEEWSHGMILDRFKVPKGDAVHVSEEALRTTVTAIFEKMGVPPEDAAIGADVLVMTDLRAVEVAPKPTLRPTKSTPSQMSNNTMVP